MGIASWDVRWKNPSNRFPWRDPDSREMGIDFWPCFGRCTIPWEKSKLWLTRELKSNQSKCKHNPPFPIWHPESVLLGRDWASFYPFYNQVHYIINLLKSSVFLSNGKCGNHMDSIFSGAREKNVLSYIMLLEIIIHYAIRKISRAYQESGVDGILLNQRNRRIQNYGIWGYFSKNRRLNYKTRKDWGMD